MKLKSLAALMMAGVMVLGLCACNSTTPDTSGSDSVSYTHLDVYKRQWLWRLLPPALLAM